MSLLNFFCSSNKNGWETLDLNKNYNVNLETPQGAILSIEAAYRSKDIHKIIACKDFKIEAEYMIKYEMGNKMETSDVILDSLSSVLNTTFENEMKESIPDFNDIVNSQFSRLKKIDDKFVIVEEICTYHDGGTSTQKMVIGKGPDGWKVLVPDNSKN